MGGAAARPFEILLVEDNPGDVSLTKAALAQSTTPHHLRVAEDGETALRFLRREGEHKQSPRPDLMLLDLNLPGKHGLEVLREVRGDPTTARLPVIILSTSMSPPDIEESYQLHANSYVAKPVEMQDFYKIMEAIDRFWLNAATLPGRLDDS